MAYVEFEDNHLQVEEALKDCAVAFLYEALAELQSETARNTAVKTGQTKGSWEVSVDEETLEGLIGSALENALWEELGTGEYALNNDGRKDGWAYQDENGNWHFTHGKKPRRMLWNAFEKLKPKIEKMAETKLKEMNDI